MASTHANIEYERTNERTNERMPRGVPCHVGVTAAAAGRGGEASADESGKSRASEIGKKRSDRAAKAGHSHSHSHSHGGLVHSHSHGGHSHGAGQFVPDGHIGRSVYSHTTIKSRLSLNLVCFKGAVHPPIKSRHVFPSSVKPLS